MDLSRLPARVDLSYGPIIQLAVIGTLLWLFMFLSSIWNLYRHADDWQAALGKLLLFSIAVFAAYLAALLFFAFWKRQRITLDQFTVTVERIGLFGHRTWSSPYTDFEGVLYREARAFLGLAAANLHIIELRHRDPAWTVPLFVQGAAKAPRERMKQYARRLKLPALMETREGGVLRDASDTRGMAGDVARAGAGIPETFDAGTPPRGLSVIPDTIDGDKAERVAITVGRLPKGFPLFLSAFPVVIVIGLFALLLFKRGPSALDPNLVFWMLALLGFSLASTLLLRMWERRIGRGVTVSRTRLVVEDKGQKADRRRRMFRLSELEDVGVKPAAQGLGKVLLVAGRSEQIEIGHGLSDESLEWLRDYILAAAARARA